jgi:hypothetical protein
MIALDYLLEQAKAEEEVDVFSCVQQMRLQRMSMVQVLVGSMHNHSHRRVQKILFRSNTSLCMRHC